MQVELRSKLRGMSVCAALQAGAAYVEAFETVLKNVAKDETVQYVLALLEDMLEGEPGRPREGVRCLLLLLR